MTKSATPEEAVTRLRAAAEKLLADASLVHARSEAQSGQIRHFLAGPEMIEYGFAAPDGTRHWRPVGVHPINDSRDWAQMAVYAIEHARLIRRTWTASVDEPVND